MDAKVTENYDRFYRERDPVHVYPVEFVVRAFLGTYPRHKTNPRSYSGKNVLDIGFGDGRNMPLLYNLGMQVYGVEISEDICNRTKARLSRLGIQADLRVGRNSSLPFDDRAFDTVLSCHSCYYVDLDQRFSDNIAEIARVLKPGGSFIFSAPKASTYILRDGIDRGDGHIEITSDPYGIRNGVVMKKFDAERDIALALSPGFTNFAIGSCQNDFWGIEEHVWVVVATKAI
ncbi:MAG: class I SAM-dependent methyltransferase [Rhizobiaceae bacterium]|nr:class I SAM-dependent methyltransferase [Rhizobiaceae bacterium]